MDLSEAGRAAMVYLRSDEGRGIGRPHQLRAYNLQDGGLTIDANLIQGLPIDNRGYGISRRRRHMMISRTVPPGRHRERPRYNR
jgi:GTP cyclohydrolase II